METGKKEKKFISLVVYLHNEEYQIVPFMEKIVPLIDTHFEDFELICVDDGCTDGTIEELKTYLEKNNLSVMVNIIHMSFHHGLESAMNAGRDLAIGDFIYEFDTVRIDYSPESIMQVYERLLEGYDIVAAGTTDRVRFTSRCFYRLYNKTSKGKGIIGPETFRIVSRRAVNRIKSMGQYIPYRKAVYANCGLKMDVIYYRQEGESAGSKKVGTGERASLALDSFIYFTNVMERLSLIASCIFLLITVGMGVYILWDFLMGISIVEGWLSTMTFLAFGFFGVFALLTIVLKYLSVLLNLIFKQQRYLISDIEKVVKE
ncbi:MAG: glycosyltransferase [Lachnospiraceae bacterium]|nr:glycosyltransferase [Lachnospiraceae bacterium]